MPDPNKSAENSNCGVLDYDEMNQEDVVFHNENFSKHYDEEVLDYTKY